MSEAKLALMRRMDALHLERAFAGTRMLSCLLGRESILAGRRHVGTEAVNKFVSVSTAHELFAEENALWSSRWIEKNGKHWQTNWPKRSKRKRT